MTRRTGSYKKPQAAKIFARMDSRYRVFLKEAAEGDRYPVREHEAVERACGALEKATGIIVRGEGKLLLYAVHHRCVGWVIEDQGLDGLYGLPSTRRPGRAKRRAEIFRYLKTAYEDAAGKPAAMTNRGPFFRFCEISLTNLAPPGFMPQSVSGKNLARAIEHAFADLKKHHGPFWRLIKWNVTFTN